MAVQDVVIQFDDLPVGIVVTNQYHDKGLDFISPAGSLLPVIAQVPPGKAHSGNQVANISTCVGCEFFTPAVSGQFVNTVKHISMFVGQFDGQADPAQIMLSAFDAGQNLLAQSTPVTVMAGGGFNTPLSIEVAAGNIASFEVSARTNVDDNKPVGIDDLTFGISQGAPPDFGLTLSAAAVEVAPGSSAIDTITVNRFNGSTGQVQFAASGLPQGVTAAFAPNPADSSTTLTFTAAPDAPVTGESAATVTVTGTPLAPSTGPDVRTVQIGVIVRANFTLGVEGSAQIDLAPCTTTQATLTVTREVGFQTDLIDLSISGLPSGVQATLDPPSVGAAPGGGFVNQVALDLTVSASQPIADTDVTVQASSGLQTNSLILHLHAIMGGIDSFTPTSGVTPQALHDGTEVIIRGAGFCQGSQVAFGPDVTGQQSLGLATPTSISADGREIHVRVPRLATDGPLTVITPDGVPYRTQDQFTVDSYRNSDGFSFKNDQRFIVTGVSFADVVQLFGYDQTHWHLIFFDVPDPLALLFTFIADHALSGHGTCSGFAQGSQRFLHGDEPLSAFSPPGATDVWRLDGPAGASPKLARYLHIQHIAQLSAEFIRYYLAQIAHNITFGSSAAIRSQIAQAFSIGDHTLIAIRQGTDGHVLVAYDLEESPTGPGDFYIDVYNPNDPFITDEIKSVSIHKKNEEISRIFVNSAGQWTFKNPDWSGDLTGLVVVPYGIVPIQPTIPSSISGLTIIVLGNDGQTTQIADVAGHTLLRPDGTLNADPATRLPQAAPFAPLDSSGPGKDIHLLGGDGPFTHTVRSIGNNSYFHVIFGHDFATYAENIAASPDAEDEFTLDLQASSLRFRTGMASKAIKVHLLARAADNDVHTAIFSTTSFQGQGDSFAFDSSRQTLTYVHSGAATDYTLTLVGTNLQGKRVSFVSPSLHSEPDDTATFAPSDWRDLGGATVTLTVVHKDGTQSVQTLSNSKSVSDPDVHVSGVTSDGNLWHTIRLADGSWQPSFVDVKAQESNDPGPLYAVDCAADGDNLQLITVTNVLAAIHGGEMWHTIRFVDGSWQPSFVDVKAQESNDPGSFFEDIGCAVASGILHVCGITTGDGQLWHTIRFADGTWQSLFDAVGSLVPSVPGAFFGVGCAVAAIGDLHVLTLTSGVNAKNLWYTIRSGVDGSWQPFEDVSTQVSNYPGTFVGISCAVADNGDLHVVGATSDGKLWHTIRSTNDIWQPFVDVKAQESNDPGLFTDNISCAVADNGVLHVVGATSDGKLWHTIRFVDGSWQPSFVDVKAQETNDPGSFIAVGITSHVNFIM